jgi:hypothetical protein
MGPDHHAWIQAAWWTISLSVNCHTSSDGWSGGHAVELGPDAQSALEARPCEMELCLCRTVDSSLATKTSLPPFRKASISARAESIAHLRKLNHAVFAAGLSKLHLDS